MEETGFFPWSKLIKLDANTFKPIFPLCKCSALKQKCATSPNDNFFLQIPISRTIYRSQTRTLTPL